MFAKLVQLQLTILWSVIQTYFVLIEEGVRSIGNYAFYGCTELKSITIASSVTSIGDYAFNGCESLSSVTIPSTVKAIGSNAFFLCENLKEFFVENGSSYFSGNNGVLFDASGEHLVRYP